MKQRQARTEQRKATFLHWLAHVEGYTSAIDLYILMRNNGVKVSYTTVYRYLYLLHEEGLLNVKVSENNEMQFCR
ncbi:MAG: transcriptional repressor [Bacteroidota bacterium]